MQTRCVLPEEICQHFEEKRQQLDSFRCRCHPVNPRSSYRNNQRLGSNRDLSGSADDTLSKIHHRCCFSDRIDPPKAEDTLQHTAQKSLKKWKITLGISQKILLLHMLLLSLLLLLLLFQQQNFLHDDDGYRIDTCTMAAFFSFRMNSITTEKKRRKRLSTHLSEIAIFESRLVYMYLHILEHKNSTASLHSLHYCERCRGFLPPLGNKSMQQAVCPR